MTSNEWDFKWNGLKGKFMWKIWGIIGYRVWKDFLKHAKTRFYPKMTSQFNFVPFIKHDWKNFTLNSYLDLLIENDEQKY